MKYEDVGDDWVTPIYKVYKTICCDCSLCHDIDFRIHKNRIQFRARRNNRSTALARRKKK